MVRTILMVIGAVVVILFILRAIWLGPLANGGQDRVSAATPSSPASLCGLPMA